MYIEIVNNFQELIAVFIIATVMSISPGSDFVMVVRNTLGFGRTAGALFVSWYRLCYMAPRALFNSWASSNYI